MTPPKHTPYVARIEHYNRRVRADNWQGIKNIVAQLSALVRIESDGEAELPCSTVLSRTFEIVSRPEPESNSLANKYTSQFFSGYISEVNTYLSQIESPHISSAAITHFDEYQHILLSRSEPKHFHSVLSPLDDHTHTQADELLMCERKIKEIKKLLVEYGFMREDKAKQVVTLQFAINYLNAKLNDFGFESDFNQKLQDRGYKAGQEIGAHSVANLRQTVEKVISGESSLDLAFFQASIDMQSIREADDLFKELRSLVLNDPKCTKGRLELIKLDDVLSEVFRIVTECTSEPSNMFEQPYIKGFVEGFDYMHMETANLGDHELFMNSGKQNALRSCVMYTSFQEIYEHDGRLKTLAHLAASKKFTLHNSELKCPRLLLLNTLVHYIRIKNNRQWDSAQQYGELVSLGRSHGIKCADWYVQKFLEQTCEPTRDEFIEQMSYYQQIPASTSIEIRPNLPEIYAEFAKTIKYAEKHTGKISNMRNN